LLVVNKERADEIGNAWLRECRFDPDLMGHVWHERRRGLVLLLRDVVPDVDEWACYVARDPATGAEHQAPMFAGIADGAVYRASLTLTNEGEFGGFTLSRDRFEDLRVSLLEKLHEELGRVDLRRRGWMFLTATGESFGLISEEALLDAPGTELQPVERIARAIARGSGWAV
jgi:hypothetical protein